MYCVSQSKSLYDIIQSRREISHDVTLVSVELSELMYYITSDPFCVHAEELYNFIVRNTLIHVDQTNKDIVAR